jgi:hypothetical protein
VSIVIVAVEFEDTAGTLRGTAISVLLEIPADDTKWMANSTK